MAGSQRYRELLVLARIHLALVPVCLIPAGFVAVYVAAHVVLGGDVRSVFPYLGTLIALLLAGLSFASIGHAMLALRDIVINSGMRGDRSE